MAQQAPFFIVGCGRSGTTLLRTMLNHHSHVAIPLESLFIIDYLRTPNPPDPAMLRRLLLREHELVEWGLAFTEADFDGCVTVQDFIDRAHTLYAKQHDKAIWGQKTPRFVRHGALLKRAYPHAKFVDVQRDPRAVVSSLIRSNVHRSNALYAARRWQRDIAAGLELEQDYPGDVLHIRYEDLITATEAVLRDVCAFLDLPFESSLLDYHKTGTVEYGAYYNQIHAKLNQAPDASRLEAWRKHLAQRQIALVESICGELMDQLEYARETDAQVAPGYVRRLKLERVVGFGRQIWTYITLRRGALVSMFRRRLRLGLLRRTLNELNY
ncbi:MAG: sulfotransferase [Anaerolineae bacterium]|nr:sulfotransferase [Anaerolineae bacterium]